MGSNIPYKYLTRSIPTNQQAPIKTQIHSCHPCRMTDKLPAPSLKRVRLVSLDSHISVPGMVVKVELVYCGGSSDVDCSFCRVEGQALHWTWENHGCYQRQGSQVPYLTSVSPFLAWTYSDCLVETCGICTCSERGSLANGNPCYREGVIIPCLQWNNFLTS
jgi:hypothetical protein